MARHGESPYGAYYRNTGMERFYTLDGHRSPRTDRIASLRHFPYFPGSAAVATAWHGLPVPWRPLPAVRHAVHAAAGARGTALHRPVRLPSRPRRGTRLQPSGPPSRLVRQRPRAVRAGDRHRVRPGEQGTIPLGRRRARRGRAVQAVRAGGEACAARADRGAGVAAPRAGRRRYRRRLLGARVLLFLVASPATVWNDTVAYGTGSFHIASYGVSARSPAFDTLRSRGADYPALGLMLGGVGPDHRVRRGAAMAVTGGLGGRRLLHRLGVRAADRSARVFQESYPLPALGRDALDAAGARTARDLGAGRTTPGGDRDRTGAGIRGARPAGAHAWAG